MSTEKAPRTGVHRPPGLASRPSDRAPASKRERLLVVEINRVEVREFLKSRIGISFSQAQLEMNGVIPVTVNPTQRKDVANQLKDDPFIIVGQTLKNYYRVLTYEFIDPQNNYPDSQSA